MKYLSIAAAPVYEARLYLRGLSATCEISTEARFFAVKTAVGWILI